MLGKQPCTGLRFPFCGVSPKMARKTLQQCSRPWCRRCHFVLPSCGPHTPWGWSAHPQIWRCGSEGVPQSWCGWCCPHAHQVSGTSRMLRRISCSRPWGLQMGLRTKPKISMHGGSRDQISMQEASTNMLKLKCTDTDTCKKPHLPDCKVYFHRRADADSMIYLFICVCAYLFLYSFNFLLKKYNIENLW